MPNTCFTIDLLQLVHLPISVKWSKMSNQQRSIFLTTVIPTVHHVVQTNDQGRNPFPRDQFVENIPRNCRSRQLSTLLN